MSADPFDDLQQKVFDFARATDAPKDSFLMRRFSLDDPDQIQSVIDGLTLSLISFCYHHHPRGENVHEIMEKLDSVDPRAKKLASLSRAPMMRQRFRYLSSSRSIVWSRIITTCAAVWKKVSLPSNDSLIRSDNNHKTAAASSKHLRWPRRAALYSEGITTAMSRSG